MAEAEEYLMTVDRGSTWQRMLSLREADGVTPIDLTDGVVFEAVIRKRFAINPRPMALFVFEYVTDGTDGDIFLQLPAGNSLTLNPKFKYEYDVWAVGIGTWKRRLIFGNIDLRNYVTPQP